MKRNLLLSALFVLGTILLNTTTQAQSFTMGFEANEPLTGWAFVNNSDSPDADWGITDNPNGTFFNAFGGTRYAAATFNSTSVNSATGATISNWFIAPNRFFRNGDVISFYTRRATSIYQDRLELRLSTNGTSTDVGTTPTSVGDFTQVLVSVNPNLTAGGYPQTWTQYTATLSGLPAGGVSGRFAFRYFVTDGGPGGNNSDFIGVDNLVYTSSYTPPAGACIQSVGQAASFGAAPCDDGSGCPFNEIDAFEVWASETYLLENVVAGNTYTFSMCNGPGANSWVPFFTIVAPDGTVETFGAGAPVACEFTWTAAASGNYQITINEQGNCGTANQIDNGFPAITCSGAAVCPPSDCEAGNIVSALSDTLCPGESYELLLANDTVPNGGTYVLSFQPDDTLVNGINLTGAGPFTINTDLDGLLPANNFPNFVGQYTVFVLVARNPADIQNSLCSISEDSIRIFFSPGPDSTIAITAGSNTNFCDGGSVTLTSNISDDIVWNNGLTTPSIAASTSGDYFVVISDSVGCTDTSNTINVIVNQVPNPTISPAGPIVLCQGDSITLTSDVTDNITWSNGLTTSSITISSSGDYYVVVSDSLGCTDTSNTVNVIVNPVPTVNIIANGPLTFCDGGNVTLTSNVANNITWNNGDTTASVLVSVDGNYFAVYSDSLGCVDTSNTISVNVNPLPLVTISPNGPINLCDGESQVFTTNNSNGNFWFSDGQTTDSIVVNVAGSYAVTYTDTNNCSATSDTVVVTTTPTVSSNFTYSSATFCSTGSNPTPTVDSIGGVFSASPTGLNFVSTSTGEIDLANSADGSYDVQYISQGVCPDTTVVNITINSTVDASFTYANSSYCKNETNPSPFFALGSSAGLFSASPAGLQFVNVNTGVLDLSASTAGTYVVTNTIAASGSCPASVETFSVTIEDIATPIITSSGPTTFCAGDSVVLTSSISNNITWSNGSTDPSITVSQSGVFSVTAESTNGSCTATSANLTVNVNQIPSAPTLTQPSLVEVCGQQNLTIATTDGSSVSWQPSNIFGNTITVNTQGVYSAVVTSPAGCTNSTSVEYVINQLPTTPVITPSGPTTFCAGDSVTLTSSVSNNILWSNGSTDASITVGQSGVFSVTSTSGSCSSTSANLTVTVNPIPAAPSLSQPSLVEVCGQQNLIIATSDGSNVSWQPNAIFGNSVTVNTSGVYSAVVTSTAGCSNSTSVEYVINPLPAAPIITANGPTTFCQGEDVELSSNVTDGIAWSTGATSGTITINNGVAGLTVTVTDTNNCSATSAPIDVVVNPLPPAPTINPAGPIVLCPGAEEDLIANVTTGIVWSNNETTPNIVVDSQGSYTVTFTDANGCSSTSAAVEVTEDDCVGVNDILFVDNLEVYPNPTNNILNINFENSQSENIVIRIISFSGKEVYSEVIGKDIFRFNKTYNFEDKAAGVYILQLTCNKGVINKKVVLQK